MSGGIALSSPRLRVIFGDPDRPETWEALDVQTTGRDMQDAEELLARNGLGKLEALPLSGIAATAYYALRRTGKRSGDWARFQDEYLEVQEVDAAQVVDPTPPDAANGTRQR